MEELSSTTPAKLTPKAILKALPKGFTNAAIPKKTRTVYVRADKTLISDVDAKKAINSLCSTFGLKVISKLPHDETHVDFVLEDTTFNKEMRLAAKACFNAVKGFYTKYGDAYRYDDLTCEVVSKIINYVENAR